MIVREAPSICKIRTAAYEARHPKHSLNSSRQLPPEKQTQLLTVYGGRRKHLSDSAYQDNSLRLNGIGKKTSRSF